MPDSIAIVVALFIIKKDRILLLKRAHPHGPFYSLVAGKLDPGELCRQAAVREAYEEVGIKVLEENLLFAHVDSRKIAIDKSRAALFFNVTSWEGEPFNREPEKHLEATWHKLDHLPTTFQAHHKEALELWKKGVYYSESVL